MKLSLKALLFLFLIFGLLAGSLGSRVVGQRSAVRQLVESGFVLAYSTDSSSNGWKNEGFGGGHQVVDKPDGLLLDAPKNQDWLSCVGMPELSNPIESVDGRRTWIDKEKYLGFIDSDLAPIRKLSGVKKVILSWNTISDVGLDHLKHCRDLEWLDLDGCDITNAGLDHLKNLHNLKRLSLAFCDVTGAGLPKLNNLKSLEYLNLEGTSISSNDLDSIANFGCLRVLNLSGTGIDQSSVEKLSKILSLEKIDVSDNDIHDLLPLLKGLPRLKSIVANGTKLDDKFVAALQDYSLDSLSVDDTPITNQAFKLILEMELKKSFSGIGTGLSYDQLDAIEDEIKKRQSN
jgi:hypothetical protein